MKSLGQIAYEAYRNHTGGKSLATGQNIPEWNDLAPVIQAAWHAAAKAVVELCGDLFREDHKLAGIEAAKDNAYAERDRLVAALSKLFPAVLMRHPDSDATWDDDWRWIVRIDLPTGQATWHIHDSELPWFDHLKRLPADQNNWDGHTTQEKYERLSAMPVNPEAAGLRDCLAQDLCGGGDK